MSSDKKDSANKIIKGDCLEELKKLSDNSVDAIVTDPPYGLEFMGKEWDGFKCMNGLQKFCLMWATECLRVIKPGGLLLAFGGTRTYHRLACGIEDVGFEIRDCIQWLYGSGFPKSLNIGKQIDKIQGNEREVVGIKSYPREGTTPVTRKATSIYGGDKLETGQNTNMETKGNSEWEGWGTALKPANEPIVVARKPLSEKNVALNVLKWGTGGINIDGCRIGTEVRINKGMSAKQPDCAGTFRDDNWKPKDVENIAQGRFPANIILDEEAGKMLGEPSRFFYCAKASKGERNFGCEKNNHPTVKPIKLMEYLIKLVSKEGAVILDPFLGSGTTAIACVKLNRNFIGIEKEEEYIKIAEARIKPYLEQK